MLDMYIHTYIHTYNTVAIAIAIVRIRRNSLLNTNQRIVAVTATRIDHRRKGKYFHEQEAGIVPLILHIGH